jgi:ribosomal protein S18 acetylase RimI-like enzyme
VRAIEVVAALRLILGSDGRPGDESQAIELMKFTAQRGINLADIWVYESGNRMRWALLPVVSPGRTVLFFGTIASVVGQNLEPMETGIDTVCDYFAGRNVQLGQVLLDPADQTSIWVYQRKQFQVIAQLLYLQRTVGRTAPPPPLAHPYQLQTYSQQTHAAFAAAILGSYENSLDCPLLNGLRNIEEIIAGHKSAGEFDPADWLLLTCAGEPVGVLLLCKTHQGDGMELVYLGLTPGARGKGLASYLMQVAESLVYSHKLKKLLLAVDAANAPALKLYYRHGMQKVTSKMAMIRELVR